MLRHVPFSHWGGSQLSLVVQTHLVKKYYSSLLSSLDHEWMLMFLSLWSCSSTFRNTLHSNLLMTDYMHRTLLLFRDFDAEAQQVTFFHIYLFSTTKHTLKSFEPMLQQVEALWSGHKVVWGSLVYKFWWCDVWSLKAIMYWREWCGQPSV